MIEARDPGNRAQLVAFHFSETCETKGRTAYLQGTLGNRPLNVCILFHRGKCKSQKTCRQLHVSPDAVDRLRDEMAGQCCALHSGKWVSKKCVMLKGKDNIALLSVSNFSSTRGLEELLRRGDKIIVQKNRICGLNKLKRCKWGERCINIHICRELDLENLASFYPSSTSCSSSESNADTWKEGSTSSSKSSVDTLSPSSASEITFMALNRFAAHWV